MKQKEVTEPDELSMWMHKWEVQSHDSTLDIYDNIKHIAEKLVFNHINIVNKLGRR